MRILRGILVVVAAMCLAACWPSSKEQVQAREKYDHLMKLAEAEQSDNFLQLPPKEQVDLYLFGVEYFRPSDYYLARYFKKPSNAVVAELIARLRGSNSSRRTFALMLVLHNISTAQPSEYSIESSFRAETECNRFFAAPSPCHQLAGDIDAMLRKMESKGS